MITFVDQPWAFKILRVTKTLEGKTQRHGIATVPKDAKEVPRDVQNLLSPDEVVETEEVLAFYRDGASMVGRYFTAKLPEIMREVVSYWESASPVEQKMITETLEHAMRLVKKKTRNGADPWTPPGA